MNVFFVTGNANKAKYFSKLIGFDIEHKDVDVEEIQSLDLVDVAVGKAKAAYSQIKQPVIVEDTSLEVKALGGLPGTFIKWFEKTLGLEGICRITSLSADRTAIARNVHVYYDGKTTKIFEGSLDGIIPDSPKGKSGFGYNPIFIPYDSQKTLAEMTEEEFTHEYLRIKPIEQVKAFLHSLDKA